MFPCQVLVRHFSAVGVGSLLFLYTHPVAKGSVRSTAYHFTVVFSGHIDRCILSEAGMHIDGDGRNHQEVIFRSGGNALIDCLKFARQY